MNLGKNLMLDTWDGQIWYPRFYDIDTILSYDNSGEIKFDVDIEMEQGYWNTSSSRLWTKIRDLMHDELVEVYKDMRANGVTYENIMHYMYDEQIAKIPQTYYNMDYDIKYAPYADEYLGKAHGDGYQHMKRWLKKRFIFCDTLYDYAPSYNNDVLTIRANTLNEMNLTIETYTPLYQHVSFYNGNMEKIKITPGQPVTFKGFAQTETDQEVLIYGGSNIKKITGIQSMNPNSMLIGGATRLTELDISNCPILTIVNSNKANFSPHTYLNKLNMSNCPQLGGNLNVSNSPLLQEIKARNSAVTGLLLPTSLRNLKTLELPNTISSLALYDTTSLDTLKFDEGVEMQSIELSNCPGITNTENFDLTQTPTVILDNSYNTEELYMSETTNLTLRNMSNLERVIYTPNSEYSEFDINNVIGGKNYKVTTSSCPKLSTFMTTAPFRLSYGKVEYKDVNVTPNLLDGHSLTTGRWLRPTTGLDDSSSTINAMLEYIEVEENTEYTLESLKEVASTICFYNSSQTFISALDKASNTIPKTFTTPSETSYIRFDVTNTIASIEQLHLYKTSDLEYIQVKDYGDITPNTAFTANTLDLADTQFQNVKFLCTTDVYNLKVPTTMKNFYCDSAMDIDTDIIEDASYEVIHEELIEPYTTNYDKNVYRYETIEGTFANDSGIWDGSKVVWRETDPAYTFLPNGLLDNSNGAFMYGGSTDFYPCGEGAECTITCTTSQVVNVGMAFFDKDKNMIETHSTEGGYTKTFISPIGTAYVVFGSNGCIGLYHSHYIKYQGSRTPNIIPSSANGSLIFNMYSNNTTQPTSTSPYMWDLTGLKLNDFHTYGMNNWMKPNDGAIANVGKDKVTIYPKYTYRGGAVGNKATIASDNGASFGAISPLKVKQGDTIKVNIQQSFKWAIIDSQGIILAETTHTGVWSPRDTVVEITQPNADRLLINAYPSGSPVDKVYFNDILFYTDIGTLTNNTANDTAKVLSSAIEPISGGNQLVSLESITMPQRMSGYSVRLVNADITPDEYPTMLYPKLIDTGLPITGKLDYTAYNGTSLAWAYAYTTGDVDISPLGSQDQGNITQDYNKLYGTDFVDIVDVWVYKDTDVSKLSTNEAITKAYIELTSTNYKTRIDEVLQWYPNCTDLYFFEDGSVTTLENIFQPNSILGDLTKGNNRLYWEQIQKITFMDEYFENAKNLNRGFQALKNLQSIHIPNNVTSLYYAFEHCFNLQDINQLPNTLNDIRCTFTDCKSLTTAPTIPNGVTDMQNCFYGCTSLTTPPTIPQGVTNMISTFNGCTALTTAPVIPQGVTSLQDCFKNCSSLTTLPIIPSGVTSLKATFYGCKGLTDITLSGLTNLKDDALMDTFSTCTNLVTVTIGDIDMTNVRSIGAPSEGYSYGGMFQDCNKLERIIGIEDWNLNNIRYACHFYKNCWAIEKVKIPLRNTDDVCHYNMLGSSATLTKDKVIEIFWDGLRRHDLNVPKLLGANRTLTQAQVKDLVNNHLDVVNLEYIEKTVEADYIDIPFGDIDYTKIRAMEVKHEYNGTQLIKHGTSGMYNMGRIQIGYCSNTIYGFMGNVGTTAYPQVKNECMLRIDATGIYEDGVMIYDFKANNMTFDPNSLWFPMEYEASFRIFGEDGWSAGASKTGKLFFLKIYGENDELLHHILPYTDGDRVGIIDDVTKKTYFGSDTTTFSYGVTSKTLTLGTYLEYLTEDEIEQATAKGWTIQ